MGLSNRQKHAHVQRPITASIKIQGTRRTGWPVDSRGEREGFERSPSHLTNSPVQRGFHSLTSRWCASIILSNLRLANSNFWTPSQPMRCCMLELPLPATIVSTKQFERQAFAFLFPNRKRVSAGWCSGRNGGRNDCHTTPRRGRPAGSTSRCRRTRARTVSEFQRLLICVAQAQRQRRPLSARQQRLGPRGSRNGDPANQPSGNPLSLFFFFC